MDMEGKGNTEKMEETEVDAKEKEDSKSKLKVDERQLEYIEDTKNDAPITADEKKIKKPAAKQTKSSRSKPSNYIPELEYDDPLTNQWKKHYNDDEEPKLEIDDPLQTQKKNTKKQYSTNNETEVQTEGPSVAQKREAANKPTDDELTMEKEAEKKRANESISRSLPPYLRRNEREEDKKTPKGASYQKRDGDKEFSQEWRLNKQMRTNFPDSVRRNKEENINEVETEGASFQKKEDKKPRDELIERKKQAKQNAYESMRGSLPPYERRNKRENALKVGSETRTELTMVNKCNEMPTKRSDFAEEMCVTRPVPTTAVSRVTRDYCSAQSPPRLTMVVDESNIQAQADILQPVTPQPGAYRIRGIDWDGNEDVDSMPLESVNDEQHISLHETDRYDPELFQKKPPRSGNEQQNISLQTPDEHDPSVKYPEYLVKARKETKRIVCIAVGIIIILAVGIGIGVAIPSGYEADTMIPNTTGVEECHYADVAQFSTAWKNCLCDKNSTNIGVGGYPYPNYETLYYTLKTMISDSAIFDISSCEAPNLALHWLIEDSSKRSGETNFDLFQRYALATCFISWTRTDPYQWKNKEGWLTEDSVCSWFGNICDSNGIVISIALGNNRISGTIPTQLSLLSQLSSLDLTSNAITASIPTEIGRLTNLEMFLVHDNEIDGNIPTQVAQMPLLEHLDLSSNNLVGNIPREVGYLQRVYHLDLSSNQLTGSLPTNIGLCTELRRLVFATNQVGGDIPSEIGLLSNVHELSFFDNKFEGSVPSTIENLQNLAMLSFSLNKMTGSIPSAIGTLTSLREMGLALNSFTGDIPSEIGSLQALQRADFYANKFTGSIASEFGNCQQLKRLDVSENARMRGTIPWELGNLLNLEYFDFSAIGLTGEVPDEICFLRKSNLQNLIGSCRLAERCDCCTSCT